MARVAVGPSLAIGPPPHIHAGTTVRTAMWDVIISLVPVFLVALYVFGFGAIMVMTVCLFGAVVGDLVASRLKGQESHLREGTTLVTGLLLALTLPPTEWWAVVPLYTLGGFLAIAVFREFMGGLGENRFNPALLARLFLLVGRTSLVYMAPFLLTFLPFTEPYLMTLEVVDATSKATPLMNTAAPVMNYGDFLFAYKGGALGETSVLALLLGAVYLVLRGHINWRIPASILGTVFALTGLLGGDPVYHVLSGGLLLGAFFMATDWVTSPISHKGKVIFGVGIGVLVVLFRLLVAPYWVPVGGVAFSILIMNALVPAIDRLALRSRFGQRRTVFS